MLHERLRGADRQGASAVRGRGLWAGVDIDPALGTGREISERLMRARRPGQGHPRLHDPARPAPRGLSKDDLDWAIEQLDHVLQEL